MKRSIAALAAAAFLVASPAMAATVLPVAAGNQLTWSFNGPDLGEAQSFQLEYSGALNNLRIFAGGTYEWWFPVFVGSGPDDFDLWSDFEGGGANCQDSYDGFSCYTSTYPGGIEVSVDLLKRTHEKTVLGIRFKHWGPDREICTPNGSKCQNNGWHGLGTTIRADFAGPQAPSNATLSTSAVPEPTTWAVMIAGFGLAGAGLRKSRALRRAQPALQLAS